MSSVRRRRIRRLEEAPTRSTSEKRTAALASAGIVAFTLLGIWLLRPGGIVGRQPRASWLIGIALGAVVIIVAFAVRPERTPRQQRVWVPSGLAAVFVVILAVWFVWPGGILRG